MSEAVVEQSSKRRAGRPYGAHYVKAIRVRFPPEVDSALRGIRRLFGVSLSDLVRMGTMRALCDKVAEAVARIRDPATGEWMQLHLIEFLHVLSEAGLALDCPEVAAVLREGKCRRATEARRRTIEERQQSEYCLVPPADRPPAVPDRARPAPKPADPGADLWREHVARLKRSGLVNESGEFCRSIVG